MKAFRVLSSGRVFNTLREAREALEDCKGKWGGSIERVHISQDKAVGFCVIETNGRQRMTVEEADRIISRIRKEGRPELRTTFVHWGTRERFATMRDALTTCRGRGSIYITACNEYDIDFYEVLPMMIDGKVIRITREAIEIIKDKYERFLKSKSEIKTIRK